MKALIVIATIIFAEISFAAEINEIRLKEFLAKWVEAQNIGSYSSYAKMYSKTFTGIKRSGSTTKTLKVKEWLKDREQMFKKPFIVKAINPEFNSLGATASIKFEQWWESERYRDKGDKTIKIKLEGETLKIVSEEMISSTVLSNKTTHVGGPFMAKADVTKKSTRTTSIFTSLKDNGCKQLSKKESMRFDNRNLARSECKAPMEWRLFTVVGGEYQWLELAYKGSLWSTEEEVITKGDNVFGAFQSVDFERVEWLTSSTGEPTALIFTVWAQDTKSMEIVYRYFVLKFKENTPYYCGAANTTNEARALVNEQANCKTSLPIKAFQYLPSNPSSPNREEDTGFTSKFSSLKHKDCKKSQTIIDFTTEHYASECPSVDGWRLFKVYDNEGRSWINIAYESDIWSPLDIIRHDPEYNFGYFPSMENTEKIEWFSSQTRTPEALIIRVNALSHETHTVLSRFIIIGLDNKVPHFCGMAKTNHEAREIASKRTSCRELLKRTLPHQ